MNEAVICCTGYGEGISSEEDWGLDLEINSCLVELGLNIVNRIQFLLDKVTSKLLQEEGYLD